MLKDATMKGECSTFRRASKNEQRQFKKPFLFDELIAETAKHQRGFSKHFKDYPTDRPANYTPDYVVSMEKQ